MKSEKENTFEKIAIETAQIVTEKNKAYGNSFEKCQEFLKILYPNGVRPEAYGDMLCVVRIFDKLMRIANQKDAFSEDAWRDINGYSLLAMQKDRKNQEHNDE